MRYVTRADWNIDRWECDSEWAHNCVPTSSVSDHVAKFTGLYDASGNPLYRVPSKVGF